MPGTPTSSAKRLTAGVRANWIRLMTPGWLRLLPAAAETARRPSALRLRRPVEPRPAEKCFYCVV
jgi:hypothetical protein